MNKYFSILFLLIISVNVFSNSDKEEIDSLRQQLRTVNDEISKVELYTRLSEKFSYINPDSSIYYGLKALLVCEENSKIKKKAYIYYLLGDGSLDVNLKSARNYFLKALEEAQQNKDSNTEHLAYIGLSAYYSNFSNVDSSLYYNTLAKDYYEEAKDTLALVSCYQNMMSIYSMINDNRATILYGEKCRALFKINKKVEAEGTIYIALSYAYNNIGGDYNLKKSELYLDKAKYIALERKDPSLLLYIYQVKGVREYKAKNYFKAITFFEKALEYAHLEEDHLNASMCNFNLGNCYYRVNQTGKAIMHFELVDQIKGGSRQKLAYFYLSLLYANVNQKKSLFFLTKHDSLNRLLKAEKDKEVLVKYKTLETEKENLALTLSVRNKEVETQEYKLESQRNKFFLVIWIVVSILILSLGYFFFIIKKQQAKKQITTLQKQALQLQLNPHFFFNALNSINSYVGEKDVGKAKYYLGKFSRLMRLTLENSQNEDVLLEDELAFIENYMILEQMNSNNFKYKILVKDELLDLRIPSMLIQPFVENSIEHAFNDLDIEGEIVITVLEENEYLKFTILDNGKGISRRRTTNEHKSIAVELLKKRVKLYSKGRFEIKFSEPFPARFNKGTQVSFKVPVKM